VATQLHNVFHALLLAHKNLSLPTQKIRVVGTLRKRQERLSLFLLFLTFAFANLFLRLENVRLLLHYVTGWSRLHRMVLDEFVYLSFLWIISLAIF
jgi:hypothetical protein